MEAVIRCWPSLARGMIARELYGHSAEHGGRCVYEGMWVGPDTSIPNRDGVRLDILAALAHLRAPVVSWPGGGFADGYHWRDGIGPAAKRPQTVNLSGRQTDPNMFGTDEFMRFCEQVGAAPYITVNAGSGTPREAREWLEYCRFPGDSSLTRMRARLGRAQPYSAPYWGVGGLPLEAGGHLCAGAYAECFTRFAAPMRALAPDIKLFACGAVPDGRDPRLNDWNHDLCRQLRHVPFMDYLSLRRHFTRGGAVDFSDNEYYGLFADVLDFERNLQGADALLHYYFPDKKVHIAVNEWGMRHPEAVIDNGMEQPNTLRDALLAASVLHLYNRWCRRVAMANLSQAVNVLQCLAVTGGDKLFLTPTYHVFDMMRPHQDAALLLTETDSPAFKAFSPGASAARELPCLDVCASLSGKKMLLTVVNKSREHAIETRIALREAAAASVSGRVLHAAAPEEVNSFDAPSRVVPRRVRLESRQDGLFHVFPPHSFTALSITLES